MIKAPVNIEDFQMCYEEAQELGCEYAHGTLQEYVDSLPHTILSVYHRFKAEESIKSTGTDFYDYFRQYLGL
jgi:hypothetical protein